MIPQRNISLISNTLHSAGGRRIPEAVIERDYVLAWLLTGLAGHPLFYLRYEGPLPAPNVSVCSVPS